MASGWAILNVPEFKAGLAKIQIDMEKVTAAATLEAGEVVKTAAQSIAPKISGDLAGSIEVQSFFAKGGTPAAYVGPTIVYGRRVELGYKKRKGRGRQGTPQEPFLAPGLVAAGDAVGRTFFSAWRRALGRF